ncbi:DUF2784 domain-containing protein [Geobacter pickeringii]|uniref:Membrane protein n=1 Tax=Geobacter pickeringii TaxID=345632 RepID=A0A0B5BDU8_9BACT|nr:DUF2784 domain-containing protein [Geobacter pickeringii]AJE02710.1 membrane protein [Geobacter pickeringii]
MVFSLAADLVVLVHGLFVLFVVAGGVAVIRWPRLAWLHLPAVVWGGVIELGGGVCPLTFLEVRFRRLAGEAGYAGSFIEHYLVPVIYPAGLTRGGQLLLGILALVWNGVVYGVALRRRRKKGRD